jgi:hypothetical protein
MAATSDESTTGAANAVDPEEVLAAAEAAHLAARQTVPIEVGRRAPGPPPGPAPPQRPVRVPTQRGARLPGKRRAPLPLAAAVAAGWAALQSYLPVLVVMALVQLTAGRPGSLASLARLGLAGWLLGHGVPLHTGAGPLGLTPIALSVFAAWRVARAGVHVTRAAGARRSRSVRRALLVGGAVGLGYGLLGVLAAVLLNGPALSASAPRAGITVGLFGLVAAVAGALGATGAFTAVVGRTPPVLRDGVRTGVVAALLVLGTGAGVAGLALAIAGADAADTVAAYRTGVAGQVGITLLCLAYAPNMAAWAAAYLVGPGFAVGSETAVRATEVTLGTLPAVPLFAGLPHAPLGGLGAILLALPAVAGLAAGWLLTRRRLRAAARPKAGRRPLPVRWPGLLWSAAIAGPVAGALLAVAAALSAGPLGGGRLAQVGPVPWQVGAVAAAVIALGTLIGAAATRSLPR